MIATWSPEPREMHDLEDLYKALTALVTGIQGGNIPSVVISIMDPATMKADETQQKTCLGIQQRRKEDVIRLEKTSALPVM